MTEPISQLRSATRRAKSDVANKLVSMFLHELSRRVAEDRVVRVESEGYAQLVHLAFGSRCPYCLCDLSVAPCVVEHLDGMNRYRAGLHIPGNVLVACRRCNSEKRRDDSLKILSLASTGWASFLSHDGERCAAPCPTCAYWRSIWPDDAVRAQRLDENRERIRLFRTQFPESERLMASLSKALPDLLAKLYSDCQSFAEREIGALLERFGSIETAASTPPTA